MANIIDKAKEGIKQVQDGVGALRQALILIIVLQVACLAALAAIAAYLIWRFGWPSGV